MFQIVLGNLINELVKSVVIVARKEWDLSSHIAHLNDSDIGVEFSLVEVASTTSGPASTVCLARELIDINLPVVTANSDQYVHRDLTQFYTQLLSNDVSGSLLTMKDDDPKWSYARIGLDGSVLEVREKLVISDDATVGIYGFSKAEYLWDSIDRMLAADDRVNSEFYVGPAYNYLIADGRLISHWNLGPVSEVMFGLGIPIDYEYFLSTEAAVFAASQANSILSGAGTDSIGR